MSNPVFLEITDINWEHPKDNKDDLPRELKLQWNNRKWTNAEVLLWLSKHFNVKVNSFNIKELVNKTSSG
tara:strand:- start:311 stop:520 length:210 start_codon:yes stop_codon:yes gene_type:complete